VALGLRLPGAVLEEIEDRPTPLYFHAYRQANYQLDRAAYAVADRLQDEGHSALAVPASQIIARDPMRGLLSHRLVGWAAGLGWWGRNNLLVHPEFGSQVRYTSVLTDAPLEADEPLEADCGVCMACVSKCPAAAIAVEKTGFDLSRCAARLDEFAKLPYVSQHICGVCIRACSPASARRAGRQREKAHGAGP
jgi:epoxyqueuosine reductase QueG